MGLIPSIMNYVRQSEQDEFRRKMYEQQLGEQASRRAESEKRQAAYLEKMAEISRLSNYTVGLEREAQQLEQQIPQLAANSDPKAQIVFDRLKSLRDPINGEISLHKSNLNVLGQNMKMALAEDNPKLQMALVSEYLAKAGIDPKAAKEEPTVKFKSKRKGKNFGDEDEVSYEVPASVADKFVQSGEVPAPSSSYQQQPSTDMSMLGALASSTRTGVPAVDNNMFTQFQPSVGSVSPMSTGEQPISSEMLFPTPVNKPLSTGSQNPFITPSPAATSLPPEGSIVVQNGKRYRITNGVPTQVP